MPQGLKRRSGISPSRMVRVNKIPAQRARKEEGHQKLDIKSDGGEPEEKRRIPFIQLLRRRCRQFPKEIKSRITDQGRHSCHNKDRTVA